MIWAVPTWLASQIPRICERLNDWVGDQAVPVVTEPTTVSFVAPPSTLQRRLTLSTPQVPLVRLAKKRNVGWSVLTQNVGVTTRPFALIASDFESVLARTLNDSFPDTTEPPESDHPPVPDSNAPFDTRL